MGAKSRGGGLELKHLKAIYDVLPTDLQTLPVYCALPFTRAKICADGRVNMCCHQSTEANLGNILESRFEDVWFSEKARAIRGAVLGGRLHHACDTTECPFHHWRGPVITTAHKVGVSGYPIEIEFDLHDSHCNFGGLNPTPETACVMCPRARPDFAKHIAMVPDRTMELAERIKHLMPYLRRLNILGIAESFWKDKIFEVLDAMEFTKHRDHTQLLTTTNGSIFNAARRKRFAETILRSHICFSLDAASRETYLRIRRHDMFDNVCANLAAWCRERPGGSKRHGVVIYNNINVINLHEVPDMVRLGAKLGVDSITLVPTHDCGGSRPELQAIIVGPGDYSQYERAERLAVEAGKEVGLPVRFVRPLHGGFNQIVNIGLSKVQSGSSDPLGQGPGVAGS